MFSSGEFISAGNPLSPFLFLLLLLFGHSHEINHDGLLPILSAAAAMNSAAVADHQHQYHHHQQQQLQLQKQQQLQSTPMGVVPRRASTASSGGSGGGRSGNKAGPDAKEHVGTEGG